jgi:hypothetical protein
MIGVKYKTTILAAEGGGGVAGKSKQPQGNQAAESAYIMQQIVTR